MDPVVLAACILLLFKTTFYFEITVVPQGVSRARFPVPFFPFLPDSNTFCNYRTTNIRAGQCVCRVLCHFVTRAATTTIMVWECSITTKISVVLPLLVIPTHHHPDPLAAAKLVSIVIILSFWESGINGSIQCVIFWDWLFFTQRNVLEIHPSCYADP